MVHEHKESSVPDALLVSADDGSMKLDERSEALEKFRNNPKYNVALISFKAGSTGAPFLSVEHNHND